ncbi:MAG: T9SS type A sorting domain-containing protein [Bacteroidia bacterium]|nr:T9SS type A sorting domain-containing protein [Bacteroidia bacterium]
MKKLILLLFFISSLTSNAQTAVSGSILSNTVWPLSGSPYIVSGNLVVFSGFTLTIDPGVTVKFNSGASLEIRGALSAIGTKVDSITFTSNSLTPTKGSWGGIKAIGTTNPLGVGNQVTMYFVKGLYANRFIDLDLAYHGPYVFKHSYFAYNNKVNHDGGLPSTSFDRCKFEFNTLGLDYCQFSSRVSNSEFLNNTDGLYGFGIVDSCYFANNTGIALSPYGITRGCTVVNNYIGVNCMFNAVNNTFINNNVSNNYNGVEIMTYFNGSITFTNNFICNNSNYNIRLLTANNADLSGNCWCTNNTGTIGSKIYDGIINTACGLVNFTPFNTNCTMTELNENRLNESSISFYPNPFRDALHISMESDKSSELILYDITSKEVLREKFIGKAKISTAQLGNGLYFYRILNNNEVLQGKIIKN